MAQSDPVIQVKHLYKHYKDKLALDNVSFDVQEKECLAFLGPNGAGKTTTMKILLAKTRADQRAETRTQRLRLRSPEARAGDQGQDRSRPPGG
jgi:ABC-type multidrug transport system ATPase subunit